MKAIKNIIQIICITISPIVGILIYHIIDPLLEEHLIHFLLTYSATVGGVAIAFFLKTSWDIKKMKVTRNELLSALSVEINSNIKNINRHNLSGISFEIFKGVSNNSDFLADLNKKILIELFDIYSDLRERIALSKQNIGNSENTLLQFQKTKNFDKLQALLGVINELLK